jgi:hypothetical protein
VLKIISNICSYYFNSSQIGAASVCESDFPEEVTATQDADEKPQGADHFLKHTLLISSDIY